MAYLSNVAEAVINNTWYENRKPNIEEEKLQIVKLAAKIISADIKDIPADMAIYPDEDCVADEINGKTFIPKTLSVLLETIVTKSQIKKTALVSALYKLQGPSFLYCPFPLVLVLKLGMCLVPDGSLIS